MIRRPRDTPRILTLAACAIALTAAVSWWPSTSPALSPVAATTAQSPWRADLPKRPNIVFVLTDDLSWNLVRFMPEVQRMQRRGATFDKYFVTNSLCCPSRASIFTGRYPHNTGVVRNTPPRGGWWTFRRRRNTTFATGLKRAGYRTAFLGKFMNGFVAWRDRPPRNWDLWFANGRGYRNYGYSLRVRDVAGKGATASRDGRVLRFGSRPRDYLVDVIRRRGNRFIRTHARERKPFFVTFSTFTPHRPTVPAWRHRRRFPNLPLQRDGAFGARTTGAPKWLAMHPPLGKGRLLRIRREWRRRARSVLAIDDLIRSVRKNLEAQGVADETYIVFSSDNGYHLGEHRLLGGKRTAFDHDIRVPLVVVGPGVEPRRRIEQLSANVDLAPTFADIAGRRPPVRTDGMSLLPLLSGPEPRRWREKLLIEYWRPGRRSYPTDPDATDDFVSTPPRYNALRTADSLYVESGQGMREFYDHTTDPHELNNFYRRLPLRRRHELHRTLQRLKNCAGYGCRPRAPGG